LRWLALARQPGMQNPDR